MRLNLYWRGRDVIDVELHVWKKREDPPADDGPPLRAAGHLQDAARAEPMAHPDTVVFGFTNR